MSDEQQDHPVAKPRMKSEVLPEIREWQAKRAALIEARGGMGMTPDELQQAREQARLKYEKLSGVTEQDRLEHESRRKVVHPAPVSPSHFKLWLAKWGGVLIVLALMALAVILALNSEPNPYDDWYPEWEDPTAP